MKYSYMTANFLFSGKTLANAMNDVYLSGRELHKIDDIVKGSQINSLRPNAMLTGIGDGLKSGAIVGGTVGAAAGALNPNEGEDRINSALHNGVQGAIKGSIAAGAVGGLLGLGVEGTNLYIKKAVNKFKEMNPNYIPRPNNYYKPNTAELIMQNLPDLRR